MTSILKRTLLALAFLSMSVNQVVAEYPDKSQPLSELWIQTSAEYRALCHQTYNTASSQFDNWAALLEKRADGKAYLPGATKPAAIILDLDETVISNIGYKAFEVRTKSDYNPEIWKVWVEFQGINEAAGPTVPGAVEFLAKVEEMGVTPVFISNRLVGQEPPTIKVLERAGINIDGIDDRLLLKKLGEERDREVAQVMQADGLQPGSVEESELKDGEGRKEGRRRLVRKRYDVLAYFGDIYGDFHPFLTLAEDSKREFEQRQASADSDRANWGKTWFVLPNPMYGSWSIGQTIPKDEIESSFNDFGFEVYLRGRRLLK